MTIGAGATFSGRRVLSLESRRAPELALLIVNYGGMPVVAPAVREIPLEANAGALAFADALIRGQYEMVVLMTGVGTRLLVQLVTPVHGRERFVGALGSTRIVARGPKPVRATRARTDPLAHGAETEHLA
jgi:uroporphyrinogen-III synthase